MLFIGKDYLKMSPEELNNCYVHFGVPEITERTFEEIVGRRYTDLGEIHRLENAINWMAHADLANIEHYAMLLSLEYGEGLCRVLDLEPKYRNYLLRGDLATRLREFKAASDFVLVAYTAKRYLAGEPSDGMYAKRQEV